MTRRRNNIAPEVPEVDAPTYIPSKDIDEILPYEFNPRDNSEAIASVAASIEEFGFLIPIVIDSDNVLVAGHTRVEAAKTLGITHVPAMLADHLSDDQIRAFRIVDNRVAEISTWDVDLLSQEITALVDSGVPLTDYWTQEELDCLSETVADDCLSGEVASGTVQTERQPTHTRAPDRTRVVLGEFVFHMPRDQYRLWANEIKEENDFEEARIIQDLQARLGMSRYAP